MYPSVNWTVYPTPTQDTIALYVSGEWGGFTGIRTCLRTIVTLQNVTSLPFEQTCVKFMLPERVMVIDCFLSERIEFQCSANVHTTLFCSFVLWTFRTFIRYYLSVRPLKSPTFLTLLTNRLLFTTFISQFLLFSDSVKVSSMIRK